MMLDQIGPTDAMRAALRFQNQKEKKVQEVIDPVVAAKLSKMVGEKFIVNEREYIKLDGITFTSVNEQQDSVPSGFKVFRYRTTLHMGLSGMKDSHFDAKIAIKGGKKEHIARLCQIWGACGTSERSYWRYQPL